MALGYNYPYSSPSAQEFTDVIAIGLTAATVDFTDGASGATKRTVQDKVGDIITPFDFGAVASGDVSAPVSQWLVGGARDRGYVNLAALQVDYPHVGALTNEIDWAAIQKTIDIQYARGGGGVYLPGVNVGAGRYYRLDGYPLLLRDYVTLWGDGPSSLIYNVKVTSAIFMDTTVILPGNMHPFYANSFTYDSASNVTEGDVVLAIADTSRYAVAMTICARTSDFVANSISDKSSWFRLYRVTAKTATTLTLDIPIDETQTGLACQ
jgi:hypothetical protein